MRHVSWVLILVTGLGFALPGGSRQQDQGMQRLLTTQERLVWEAMQKRDTSALGELLADGYREIGGPAGGRRARDDAMKQLAAITIADYRLEDAETVLLSKEAAILTYKATLKGSQGGKPISPNVFVVSSAWAERGGKWRCEFRQWTPTGDSAPDRSVIEAFDLTLGANTLLYTYKGPEKLQDVKIEITLTFRHSRLDNLGAYWASWHAGEAKEINLSQLAFGMGEIERLDLTGTAMLGGKPVALSAVSRREK